VIFYTHNGCLTTRWFPAIEDGALDEAALAGTTLEALTPFVQKLLLPRGLRSMNEYGGAQSIGPHEQATGSKLTCAPINDNRYATSRSLDHEIAEQINPNQELPLVLSVGPYNTVYRDVLSYRENNSGYGGMTTPEEAYAMLTDVLGVAPGQAEHRIRRHQSVIDVVSDDLRAYQAREMASADREVIDTWLSLLREAELGISACTSGAVPVGAAEVAEASQDDLVVAFTIGADMMMKLMALNMICDINRSLVLRFSGGVTFNWDGIEHSVDHSALSHRDGTAAGGGACLPNVYEMVADIDRWYARKYAKLIALLDAIPEGEGTLLDNTATMWLPEFSDGHAHSLNNLPIVVAGSAGGTLRQGVAVNVEGQALGAGNSEAACGAAEQGAESTDTGSTGGNVPINKLYVTLMNAVGCTASDGGEVTSFGVYDGYDPALGITDPGELTALKA
jgi:hypothetical protein